MPGFGARESSVADTRERGLSGTWLGAPDVALRRQLYTPEQRSKSQLVYMGLEFRGVVWAGDLNVGVIGLELGPKFRRQENTEGWVSGKGSCCRDGARCVLRTLAHESELTERLGERADVRVK